MTEVETLQAENARLRRWLVLNVAGRLAEHLFLIAKGTEKGWPVVVRPPVHPVMAKAIGCSREHVSWALTRWERQGLIKARRCNKRDRVAILLAPDLVARVSKRGK
jgi:hypothetical protein